MHNEAYYQPQMLCIGLHLSGRDSCSYSLYKMEELCNAQYFISFLVLTWQFWTKWSDKHLNFTSDRIFCGPWIIWTLFHKFSIFAIILPIRTFFQYPKQSFVFIACLSLWTLTWASAVEEKTWPVCNNNSWCTGTSSIRAAWNQDSQHPGCTIKHGTCVLDFSTSHFTKD